MDAAGELKGFTLVELMVTIALSTLTIGALLMLMTMAFTRRSEEFRRVVILNDGALIQRALSRDVSATTRIDYPSRASASGEDKLSGCKEQGGRPDQTSYYYCVAGRKLYVVARSSCEAYRSCDVTNGTLLSSHVERATFFNDGGTTVRWAIRLAYDRESLEVSSGMAALKAAGD
ncbi:MAG: prepilin-type N-terminal cleavage/methylation domain-containing protein [Elusimicrobia bacterium]|nr:prepilin-type N-terminal cleavage/methylation domain-containing protein [Elusimicrobiota bacterium]